VLKSCSINLEQNTGKLEWGGMLMNEMLSEKRILIVDDEPDVLDTLKELLDVCVIDSAPSFETAKKFLEKNTYDAAILDIMGVDGFKLLELVQQKGIPALMLTAHALSAKDLVKSIQKGAYSYIPKHEMINIGSYLTDVINAKSKSGKIPRKWFKKLSPFFDKKFGPEWKNTHRDILDKFDLTHTREELEKIL
jgi:CheY-like chemotaxis protein